MSDLFKAAQTETNPVRAPSQPGISGKQLRATLKIVKVTLSLRRPPGLKRVRANAQKVRLGAAGKTNRGHG